MLIDKYKRYQNKLYFNQLYPKKNDGVCDCGCNKKLNGRKKRWASKVCLQKKLREYYIIKGDIKVIREQLFKRDNIDNKVYCANCNHKLDDDWEADHIIEVRHGGGGCDLDNYQILCKCCHKIKTKKNYNIELLD